MSQVENKAPLENGTGCHDQAHSVNTVTLFEWITEQEEDDKRIAAERAATESKVKKTSPILPSVKKSSPLPEPLPEIDLGDRNWVGLLLEFRNAYPHPIQTKLTEGTVGQQRFVCTATIAESSEVFGSTTVSFGKKKDAKRYACKCAIEWLIEHNFMPAQGGVRLAKVETLGPPTPKVSILGAPRKSDAIRASLDGVPSMPAPGTPSYAHRVASLSTELGFSPPTYVAKQNPEAAAIWSIFAHFPGDPRVHGKAGESVNVYGKKSAKEACAKQVLQFLESIRDGRIKEMEENREASAKRKRSLEDEGGGELLPQETKQEPDSD